MLLNFSDEANAHRSVRFSSRAVHVSSALLFSTRMAIIRDAFFIVIFQRNGAQGRMGRTTRNSFLSSGMYSISVSAIEAILL